MRGLQLTLKSTQDVDLVKTFDTHITKKYSKEAAANAQHTFKEMQKQRNVLDFAKMQAQLNNDYRLAPEFQLQLINYIRYIYLVDNFFKSDFPDQRHLKLNFSWSDSLQTSKKFKSINHIKYELTSCLYNLAICYYIEGIHYIAIPNGPEKLKGIAKLRNAIWCINEIKQVLPTLLVNPSELPSDLNLSFINLLQNYFIGLTYSGLVEIMSLDAKNGPEKLASVNKAAAKYFQIAYDIIAASKQPIIPEPKCKSLKLNLVYNTVMFRSEAYYNIAITHVKKVDDEILKGHMGYAVSYLRIPKRSFDELFKTKTDFDVLTPEQRSSLAEKEKLITSNYDNCLLKNQKVYRQQEFNAEQLPEIPEEKAQITPIEPKDIKKKLDEEANFQIFVSPEILGIKSEFQSYVSMKVLEVENALKNANNVKNKQYSEGYVNYLLDLETQSSGKKIDIPPQLKAKIEKFKQNGGANAYHFTKKNIVETSANCDKLLHEVKGLLANEKQEDEELRKQFPNQWNRPYSEQVNQDYVFKMRDLEQKFFIAQNTDKDINKKFDQYQDWMQKFSLPDEQILALIPKNSDNEFIMQNRAGLSELVATDKKVSDLIDLERQRAALVSLTDEYMKGDFLHSFSAIHAKQVDKQAEFDKLLAPYQAKLAQFTNQINEAYPLLDYITNQARQLNSSRSEGNQGAVKILEEMSLAITVINDIFNDFQQGVKFYGNLHFHLTTLQKVVADYCLAREIEKNALLQELQAQKNYEKNFNAPKPYFQENSMQFPKGFEESVPSNPSIPNSSSNQPPVNQSNQYQNPPVQQHQGYNPNMYNPSGQQQQQPHYQQQQQPQGFNPQGHGQGYNPNYGNPNQYNPQYGNPNMGQYGHPNQGQPQMPGNQGQFGNVVQGHFVPPNNFPNQGGNPYYNNQGKPPGQR